MPGLNRRQAREQVDILWKESHADVLLQVVEALGKSTTLYLMGRDEPDADVKKKPTRAEQESVLTALQCIVIIRSQTEGYQVARLLESSYVLPKIRAKDFDGAMRALDIKLKQLVGANPEDPKSPHYQIPS